MASFSPLQFSPPASTARSAPQQSPRSTYSGFPPESGRSSSRVVTVSAVGDVSSNGNIYLFAGAAAAALIGTAFPILFSRKDLCPECDGAGFVRQADARLRTNAARKDLPQIVCPRCNGLGKLRQIDK
ncbi:hypothetical protein KSP39_PZI021784 [Platanthera zijinensis]|uniref:Uncharacterized protein n=1 Tax=Platanthera zijinensis TaxID=2320716 RepID=A0AAP0FW94_9ASPA